MSLSDFLQLMREHLFLLFVFPLVFSLVAALYAWNMMPDVYTATGTMNAMRGAPTVVELFGLGSTRTEAIDAAGVAKESGYSISAKLASANSTLIVVTGSGPDGQKVADIINEAMKVVEEKSDEVLIKDSTLAIAQVLGDESEVIEALLGQNIVSIVSFADNPSSPSGPKRFNYVLYAFVIGLVLAALIIVLFDAFKKRRQSKESLEDLLHLPVIPKTDAQSSILLECIKAASIDEPIKTVAVFSTASNEGSSEISEELAKYASVQTKRCLLVNVDACDLGIQNGEKKHAGDLYSLVMGDTLLESALEKNAYEGVDVVSAGECIPNMGDIFSSQAFARVINDDMKSEYDFVIFDASPLFPIPDSLPLAEVCDCVIFVVGSRQNDNELLRASVDELIKRSANIICVALGK